MPTAEASVATDRAGRYLVQLCRHTAEMSGSNHRPAGHHRGRQSMPLVEHADCSDTDGIIRFADGRCVLRATEDTLILRLDAPDEDALRRLQESLTRRLEIIGRRDDLTLNWHQPDTPARHDAAP